MNLERRMKNIKVIEKMKNNQQYSQKLGLVNKSYLKENSK